MIAVADFEIEPLFAAGQAAAGAQYRAGTDGAAAANADAAQAGINADIATAVIHNHGVAVAAE